MNFLIKPARVLTILYTLSVLKLAAQAPTITSQAGFPVALRGANQVAYGNGRYILLAVYNYTGNFNSVYRSTTGQTWTHTITSGIAATPLNYIVFAAGVFVAVGNNGIIQTSADGVSWTTRSSGSTQTLYKIYYINSTFFAMGNNRTMLKSTDGITWSAVSISTGNATDVLVSMAYGNGAYVVAARNGIGGSAVYRSNSAANNSWTYADQTTWPLLNRIQYLNNKFFAFFANNVMYNSSDGTTWTNFTSSVVLTQPNSTTTSWTTSHQIFNGVWDGTRYLFYGSSAYYQGYGSTFTSTDGVNFTLLTKTAYIVPQESTIINSIYFVCGNEGVVTSTNGTSYQHSGPAVLDMVKTANRYVTVGLLNQEAQIFTSPDFSTWTNRTPAGVRELYAAAYDSSRILATGNGVILSSTDEGDTWNTVPSNSNESILALSYGNGRFVGAGNNSVTGTFLRYSTDGGTTWTSAGDYNIYSIIKIKFVNNRFFAFVTDATTYLAKILYSTDGISWTDVTPSLGYEVLYYKDAAFDGTKYHFWGMESSDYTPTAFFSVSTATPAVAASYGSKAVISNIPEGAILGGGYDEGVLDFADGKLTGAVTDVITQQDYIIYSTNGSSWTAIPQNSYNILTASYSSGKVVRMVGRANSFVTADYNVSLPVSLMGFDGYLEESSVKLNWATAIEQKSEWFIVQHSTDGHAWNRIGAVAAAGTSSAAHQYSFQHKTPVAGINLYRLLMQDKDSSTSYSRVISINTNNKSKLSLYPNPVNDELIIQSSSAQRGQIIIYNLSGQEVQKAIITGTKTTLSVRGLSPGTYVADIMQGEGHQQIRISKK